MISGSEAIIDNMATKGEDAKLRRGLFLSVVICCGGAASQLSYIL
jgi:hypothetical protein